METTNPTQNKKKSGGKCGLIILILAILFFTFLALANIYNNSRKVQNRSDRMAAIAENESRKLEESQKVPTAPREKLMEYFSNVVFNANDGATYKNIPRDNLWKWDKGEVRIELSGDYDQATSDFLNSFIVDFNNISTSTKLIAVKNNGDIKISFQSHEKLAHLISNSEQRARKNYGWTMAGTNCQMKEAAIYMESDTISDVSATRYVLGHELLHALGFSGHDSGEKYCNYMAPIPCGPIKGFTQYDEFAIKAVYGSGSKACENKKTVLKRMSN